jgi:hypothetical protein
MMPAETMRAAADRLREPPTSPLARLLADWLDSAATDAEEIGPDFRAERVAAAILCQPDPYPNAPAPARAS